MNRMRPKWIIASIVGIAAVSVIALCCVIFLIGVYRWHWETPFAVSVANALPIPAANFAGHPVLLRDYYRDVKAVKTYLSSDEAKSQGIARSVTDADRKQVLERLIAEDAINEAASLRNITIKDGELDQLIDSQFNASGTTRGDLEKYIQTNYGWTFDDFKMHIARPALLTRYLTASFAVDHPNQQDALNQYMIERMKRSDVVRYLTFQVATTP